MAFPLRSCFWSQSWAFAELLARALSRGRFGPESRNLAVIKTGKGGLWAFPKRAGVGTYRSHPGALPGVAFSGSLRTGSIGAFGRWPDSFRKSVFRKGKQRFIAGWSSPVARQAHNLKVIGSNPIPATTDPGDIKSPGSPATERRPGFFLPAAKLRTSL